MAIKQSNQDYSDLKNNFKDFGLHYVIPCPIVQAKGLIF